MLRLGITLLIILVAAVVWQLIPSEADRAGQNPTKIASVKPAPPEFDKASGRYLFNGTIFWGRAIEKWSLKADGKYDYNHPFSGLDSFNRDKYDAWVADLECPVLDITIPYQTQVDELQFNCRPEFMAAAAKYFNIIDLANNHSGDKGRDGFLQTRQRVEATGAQAFGDYDPAVADNRCEVIALPIKLLNKASEKDKTKVKKANLPVAFCAYHYFFHLPKPGELATIKKYSAVMPTFAFVHMGKEYATKADTYQEQVAHKVADQNPDFVIMNNPHWIQNSEVYKNKLIVYSTGNFIFDQVDSEGMRSASIDAKMTVKYDANLAKWIKLGQQCDAAKTRDNCLDQAVQQGLKKPEVKYLFGAVAGDNSGHLTKKGSPTMQKAVLQRLNWAKTLQQLGQD